MADNELDIIVRLKNLFSKESQKVDKDIKGIGTTSAKAAKGVDVLNKSTKKTESTFSKIAKAGTVALIAKGIFNIAKNSVNAAKQMETFSTQFEVLTGSAEEAAEVLQDLSDFSAGTPFQFTDIAKAGKQLIAFGIEVDEVKNRLAEIGDVAAATGSDFGEVTTIFGQIQAAGKLTGERLLQLQERAIPIGPALAKTLGVAETELRGLVSAGKVTTEVFNKAFATLSGEGGVAFGGMSKLSETLEGKISTLKDNFQLLAAELGTLLLPLLKKGADILTNFAKAATRVSKELRESRDATIQAANADRARIVQAKTTIGLLEQTAELLRFSVAENGLADALERIGPALRDANLQELDLPEIRTEEDVEAWLAAVQEAVDAEEEILNERTERIADGTEVADNAEKNKLLLEQEREKQEALQKIKDEYKELEMARLAEEDEGKIEKIEAEIALLALTEAQKAKIKEDIRAQESKALAKQYKKDGKLFEAFLIEKGNLNAKQAQDFVKWEDFMANAKNSKNKEVAAIGKAIAIKDIGVKTAQAAMGAWTAMSAIPIVGPVLGAVAAAAAIAFGAEQISAVNSGGSFASGGIVGGSSFTGDNVPANVNSGEMILNGDQQEELFETANGGGEGGGGDMVVNVNIDGKTIMNSTIRSYNEDKKSGILEVDFQ